MSLYTKYRPRDWDSVIGQDRIKTILRNSLMHDRTGHAYLFHGSRGTGKTTSARILAKGVNCTNLHNGNPCHTCANCIAFDEGTMLDIIEIDAASNTGVDNIRDLIEKARFEPNQGKYKVYIIDEVHMLSTGAFNALLKTLEEPPVHVKFILATTEAEKVPETIRSRALRFDFRKITESDIIDRLKFVISQEQIQAEEPAIKVIAKYARGGLRDALTLLEQNTIDSELSYEHVRMTLSLLEESQIEIIIESLRNSEIQNILDIIANLRDIHVSARGFFEQVMYRLRDLMIEQLNDQLYYAYQEIYEYFEFAYTRVRVIPDGMLLIEMTLLKIVKRGGIENRERKAESRNEKEKEVKIDVKKDNSNISGFGGGNLSKNSSTKNNIQEEFSNGEEKSNTDEQSEVGVSFSSLNSFGTFATKSTEGGVEKGDTGLLPRSATGQAQASQGQTQGESNTENQASKTTPPFSYIVLLEALKSSKPALVIDLKTARFEREETHLMLIFPKNWNYNRVNTNEAKNTITDVLAEKFGGQWSVDCRLDEAKNQVEIANNVF